MFYHARKLKYVRYGKVNAFVNKDDPLISTYKWLSEYCKFYPQIWLSRSSSNITGKKLEKDKILFAFNHIMGFSLDYEQWENVLMALFNEPTKKNLEKRIIDYFNYSNAEDDIEKLKGKDRIFPVKNYENWRDNYLFVENDQVVIPRLNLKSAKEIICRNEMQKRTLRKMGFIEDRIKIMNFQRIN